MMGAPGTTPGPWVAKRVDYDRYGLDVSFEVKAGRRVVAGTYMREIKSETKAIETDEANVHLIAAAPALYDALEHARRIVDEAIYLAGPDRELALRGRLTQIDAALAQARGEA